MSDKYDNKLLLTHPLVKKALRTVFGQTKLKLKNSSLGWTQNALARDKKGRSVTPNSSDACSFSLIGAIRSVEPHVRLQYLAVTVLRQSIEELYRISPLGLHEWNDSPETTSEKVFRVIDQSIKRVG